MRRSYSGGPVSFEERPGLRLVLGCKAEEEGLGSPEKGLQVLEDGLGGGSVRIDVGHPAPSRGQPPAGSGFVQRLWEVDCPQAAPDVVGLEVVDDAKEGVVQGRPVGAPVAHRILLRSPSER